jgi:transposase
MANKHLKRTQRDYSLAFKLQVVNEMKKGLFTWKQSQVKYGIQGKITFLVWLRKRGTLDWLSKIPVKKKAPSKKHIEELKKISDLRRRKRY